MRHPIDTAVMSGALWLLAVMLIDALTPKELSIYVIAAVLAPAICVAAALYHLKAPRPDIAITLAALWLISILVLECVTPQPMSPYFIPVAIAPAILIGAWFHVASKWRSKRATSQPVEIELARRQPSDST